MSTEALPCPFCGSSDVIVVEASSVRWRHAMCNDCGATAPEVRCQTLGERSTAGWAENARQRAISEWNRRKPPGEPRGSDEMRG